MFKPARWWSEKNKVKAVFKLQFHASQVTQIGGDGLMISVVPADTGRPTVKSDKAAVRNGSCLWENPVYETVKFNQDPKSGKIHERIYYFVIGTGLSKAGVVGEASIDLSNYAEANKVSLVSLPLKNSKTEAVLHVSIQRIQESMDQRVEESDQNGKLYTDDHGLRSELSNHDADGTITSDSVEDAPVNKTVSSAELNVNGRASSGSDVTMPSSESSSEIETPWELQIKSDDIHREQKFDMATPIFGEHRRSWEWLGSLALEASTDDSSSTPREAFLRQQSEEAPDIVIEKLKSELAASSRQVELSELELQTLRKQIVKESKRGQDLGREVVCLKEERDALKGECERFKAFQRRADGVDSRAIVEELRQELNHAKEMNVNLRIQLQKTQESNSELILAVQELDEMLEQKKSGEKDVVEKSRESSATFRLDDDDVDDDEEQKALEELVKDHSESKEADLLEQQIMDLQSEIEIYKRDKDELEMQMEQLALDYEITKQENHEMLYKLEQIQIQEQLKMHDECSSSDAANELETQMENMENELKRRSEEYVDSLVAISELEARAKSLEEELEKQARGFEADLEALTRSKVEQEQRAIRAEETLKKMRWKNANMAERLQDEFRKLSVQMQSTFEANEKLATKAMAEANELRLQKSHLEEMLRKTSEEHQSVEGHYQARLHELAGQVVSLTNQIEQMHSEIEDRNVQLEHERKRAEETHRLLSNEISALQEEIEMHVAKNKIMLEDMGSKEILKREVEQMRLSVKEMELLVEQGNDERIELEKRVDFMKNEAEETHKELNQLRCLVDEKELMVESLQSELDSHRAQCAELKRSLSEDGQEKEKLRKQASQLRNDLKKREDAIKNMEKKIKDGSGRGTTLDVTKATSKTSKSLSNASKEVASLKETIKFLEGQIKLKETALETSANAYHEKEKDLHNRIEELEGRLEVLNHSSARFCVNEVKKLDAAVDEQARNSNEKSSTTSKISNINDCAALSMKSNELSSEIALLKERNKSMEGELKEMQERYSEISLKFAEVEGEREQLVMKLRSLKNGK
ncbi:hypothetical protein Salat_1845700 [Sesamum alatum]|uniref:C2 NT-type domain-containing protein n=1 Tax=Sesamum alatum TaxID=300844 RepID=A0AAE1Y352_9LAMI|nr:hypothetical protein Salat_1845700 [Sesamum alatum]